MSTAIRALTSVGLGFLLTQLDTGNQVINSLNNLAGILIAWFGIMNNHSYYRKICNIEREVQMVLRGEDDAYRPPPTLRRGI